MYICLIGLFVAAFQVTCDGAPERLVPALKLPADVSQEEKFVEKRAPCTNDQLKEASGCGIWKARGYCEEGSVFYDYVQDNCYATCGNCEVPPTPPPKVDEDACLAAHNAKRALHQETDPLTWSDTLAQHAKVWADHLAATGGSGHDLDNQDEGENIYKSWSSTVRSCAIAVDAWYGEIKDYNYDKPGFSPSTGHFTQVVWKGTTQVGAALVKTVDDQGFTVTYVVARYSPRGNSGQYGNNVMPTQ